MYKCISSLPSHVIYTSILFAELVFGRKLRQIVIWIIKNSNKVTNDTPVNGQISLLMDFRSVGSSAMVLPGQERGVRVIGHTWMVTRTRPVPAPRGEATHERGVRFEWPIPAIVVNFKWIQFNIQVSRQWLVSWKEKLQRN